jgi:hypothetical protein
VGPTPLPEPTGASGPVGLSAPGRAPAAKPDTARLAASHTLLPDPLAADAPSAPYVKKASALGAPVAASAAAAPRPAAPPAARPAAPPATPASSLLRSSPTMIPDDDFAPTQAFTAPPVEPDDPTAFGEESTVVAPLPSSADATVETLAAGSRPPPSAASDPFVAPIPRVADATRGAGSASDRAAPAPREATAPGAASDFDEPAPPKRSWLLPVLGAVLLLGALGVGGVVAVGSALLSGAGVEAPAEASGAPASGAAPPAATTGAAASAAPAAPATVEGGMNFVSAAPDTAKITVSCDGTEVSGATSVGLAAASAQKCAVKVMLSDRTRLVAEIAAPEPGTYRCFEGGSKECVR